jgi:hypothetical protein
MEKVTSIAVKAEKTLSGSPRMYAKTAQIVSGV